MDDDEIEGMREHLSAYQASGKSWDEYRRRIRGDLLAKWIKIKKQCRKSGFFSPWADVRKIRWNQVITTNLLDYDECVMCENTIADGSCRGRSRSRLDRPDDFIPCWKKGELEKEHLSETEQKGNLERVKILTELLFKNTPVMQG